MKTTFKLLTAHAPFCFSSGKSISTFFAIFALSLSMQVLADSVKQSVTSNNLPKQLTADLKAYNVVWDKPSGDSFDTMPLSGSKGAGANVWVEVDGSIWFYLAHNSAYTQYGQLFKLGYMRLHAQGVDLHEAKSFKQTQDLATDTILIEATTKDNKKIKLRLRFLGETLMMDSVAPEPMVWDVSYGTWSNYNNITPVGQDLLFVSKNGASDLEETLAKQQNVPSTAILNLLPDRNFGGALVAQGGLTFAPATTESVNNWRARVFTAKTISSKTHVLAVTLGCGKNAEPSQWQRVASELLDPANRVAAEKKEDQRWAEFWNRSFIVVEPTKGLKDPAFQVGRNYQLFRQMLACNAGGEFPLKFNGGIFTTDSYPDRLSAKLNFQPGEASSSPDYRRWGQMFMAQNQRWLGWPTIASNDADLLAPTLTFYRDRLAIAKARAKNIGATSGACYTEILGLEGFTNLSANAEGLCTYPHLYNHFSIATEIAWMALQGHSALGINIDQDIPWMVEILRFYDSFYRFKTKEQTKEELGKDGKLVIYPATGLERWLVATNPIEVVAGLRQVSAGLLALPELSGADRDFVKKFQATLPELPTRVSEKSKKMIYAPAAKWEGEANPWELSEMYPAFPYHLIGIAKPTTLEQARETWTSIDSTHQSKQDYSWQAQVPNTANLGLSAEAKERVILKLSDSASCCRYPAFFGPGHDWMPDHNWGGSGMTGLQQMLLIAEPNPTGKIYLFPAWPKEWDVRFKLHTDGQTTVECELKNGVVSQLKVTPEKRKKDVIIMPMKTSLP